MTVKAQFELMAVYNRWMNAALYRACGGLDEASFQRDTGAFFGSLCGTLNHLLVADTLWLKRFALHPTGFAALEPVQRMPAPTALNQILHPDLASLQTAREALDDAIINFSREATAADYETDLHYRSTKGLPFQKPFGLVVQHFYNHQTHHRGQATTLLSQFGIDVGVTDLLVLIPDVE